MVNVNCSESEEKFKTSEKNCFAIVCSSNIAVQKGANQKPSFEEKVHTWVMRQLESSKIDMDP